ncbi:hypothetical protein [Deinococcus aquaedulcis]|uniref:hypothetical protein n=1 Tax=Deinococcus aquaedulcis TaxID=2840455 RepID=UPI001C829C40|nr:hypothetical protein [Deinococcus aquaedulcis]
MTHQTLAQQFVAAFQALPQPNPEQSVQTSAHHQALADLWQRFGARDLGQPHGDDPVAVFPDRSAIITPRDLKSGLGVAPSWRREYQALSEFEVERLVWQHRAPQGAIFIGQRAVTDESFWALKLLTTPRFLETARAPQRTHLREGHTSFEILGHARNLLQCRAVVDGRTSQEREADEAQVNPARRGTARDWLAALGEDEKAQQALAKSRGLQGGIWIEVTFWLAWVQLQRWTLDGPWREDRLYLVHPRLGYGDDYNMMLGDLAQRTRRQRAGDKKAWVHDYRDWFAGRDKAIDPRGDGDIG